MFRTSSPEQKCFTRPLKYCRCSVFIKENGTNPIPFRHCQECAFHPFWLILLRKIRYKNPFSIYKANTRGFRGPFSVLQFPSNHSLESGRAPKLEQARHPTPQSPPQLVDYFRPRNSNTSSRETENTNGEDPSSAGASHPQTRSAGDC